MANRAITYIDSCSVCPHCIKGHLRACCTCNTQTPILITYMFYQNDNIDIPDWCPNLANNKKIINTPKKPKL